MAATTPVAGGADSKKRIAFRIGYAAHGAVYLLVGILAVSAAFGGGQAEGGRGAISELATATWGTVLLTVLAVGLLGFTWLRLWQGIGNPEGHGNDAKGIGKRIGRILGGLGQAALALYALSLAYNWFSAGASGGGGGSSTKADVTARILSWTGGQWVIGAIGVIICIAAFAQLSRAIKASFLDDLGIRRDQERWVRPLGRAGYTARFVVFLTVGIFVIVAAYQAQPGETRGLGGALRTLHEQPYGAWLLAAVGVGFVAFAIVRGVYARYAILPQQRHALA